MLKKLILLLACCSLSGSAWGGAPRTVAVFPFAVHSQEKLEYLGQGIADMLLTRMEEMADIATIDKHTLRKMLPAEGVALDERLARELARSVGADYAVTGSISKIGAGVSIDALILDTSGRKENRQVYVRCDGLEGVPDRVAQLAVGTDLQRAARGHRHGRAAEDEHRPGARRRDHRHWRRDAARALHRWRFPPAHAPGRRAGGGHEPADQ